MFPFLAAVFGSENSSCKTRFFVGAKGITESPHINPIRILRMHPNFADVTGFPEADIFPGFSGIGRFINTIAKRNITPDCRFTHPCINHIWIRMSNRQSTNRSTLQKAVGNIFPVCSSVFGFPDTACRRTKIKDLWIIRVTCDRYHTSSARWTYTAPTEGV